MCSCIEYSLLFVVFENFWLEIEVSDNVDVSMYVKEIQF